MRSATDRRAPQRSDTAEVALLDATVLDGAVAVWLGTVYGSTSGART